MNWSYIAGFWDGEGSLLHPFNNGKKTGWRWRMSQNSSNVLYEIQSFLTAHGIKSSVVMWKRLTAGGNRTFTLSVESKINIYKIITQTKDYSIVKKRQIAEFLEWFEGMRAFKIPIRHCHGLSLFYLNMIDKGISLNKISCLTGETRGRLRQLNSDRKAGLVTTCVHINWEA